jgi:putative ABC transport system permease protein
MIAIGWRNLRRDRWRTLVAVLGVVFAVVLVTLEVGMLLGLMRNASLLIDRSRADLWVSTVDVQTFDFATPVEQRKKHQIRSVPGVARVEEYNVSYGVWKLPSGGNTNCQVVSFDVRGELHAPLDLAEGSLEAIHNQDAVFVDEGERAKLGGIRRGDAAEILERRAKIAGFTRGMRSFTTTPYVFTALSRSETYGWLSNGAAAAPRRNSVYFLVRTAPGEDAAAVCRAIERQVPDVAARTRADFSWRTRRYWLVETGVGVGFLAASVLGLTVGGVIVSQTLYSMTVEKLPEFGVLKAMGATMAELSAVVLQQGLLCGAAGLAVGLVLSAALAAAASLVGTAVLVPWPLAVAVTLLTAFLCSCASLVSIARLRRIEPTAVFRA